MDTNQSREVRSLVYLPSDAEKAKIDAAIRQAIECFKELNVNQKAFALANMVDGFERTYGLNIRGAELLG